MTKKTQIQILEDLKSQQKNINDKITKLEQKQLLKVGKSAQKHSLTDWSETSLEKAFIFLKEQGEQEFSDKTGGV